MAPVFYSLYLRDPGDDHLVELALSAGAALIATPADILNLTIRLPDDKHARLKDLARHRNISVNKLMEEFSTIALAEFDTEMRFRALAAQGVAGAQLDQADR